TTSCFTPGSRPRGSPGLALPANPRPSSIRSAGTSRAGAAREASVAAEAAEPEERVRRALAVDVGERVLGLDLGVVGSLGADAVGELFGGVLIGGTDDQGVPAAHRLAALVLQLPGELAGLFVGGELGADLVGGPAVTLGGLFVLDLDPPLVLGLMLG